MSGIEVGALAGSLGSMLGGAGGAAGTAGGVAGGTAGAAGAAGAAGGAAAAATPIAGMTLGGGTTAGMGLGSTAGLTGAQIGGTTLATGGTAGMGIGSAGSGVAAGTGTGAKAGGGFMSGLKGAGMGFASGLLGLESPGAIGGQPTTAQPTPKPPEMFTGLQDMVGGIKSGKPEQVAYGAGQALAGPAQVTTMGFLNPLLQPKAPPPPTTLPQPGAPPRIPQIRRRRY